MEYRISEDKRHGSIYVLNESSVETRTFQNWSMGFSNWEKQPPTNTEGCSHFLQDGFTQELVSTDIQKTHKLLLSFKDTLAA